MIIFDIETKTFGTPDPTKDEFKFFAGYDVTTGETYFTSDLTLVKSLLKKHRILVGYNSQNYDEPILKRAGVWSTGHTHIDLYQVIKKRDLLLGCQNESKSLRSMAKFFGLNHQKGELDYSILKQETFSESELNDIRTYAIADIETTFELFVTLCKFFEPFKQYMKDEDVRNYKWLTSSVGAYAYKVICNQCGIEETYNDNIETESYEGGFVAEPITEEEHGNILCYDFASLYPNILIQCNLYSHSCKCCSSDEKWNGGGFFDVKGKYCVKKQGRIEQFIKKMYLDRVEFKKKGDKREYTVKIICNSVYGITGSPVFKQLYNYNTVSDCTAIARKCVKFAIETFEQFGFKVLYADTDSNFVKIPDGKTKRDSDAVAEYIVKEIQKHMIFPH